MARKIKFEVDEWYHCYNRGVDKRVIFDNDYDYSRFIKLLYICNHSQSIVFRDLLTNIPRGEFFDFPADQSLVDIRAYCLMPNHFHLLLDYKKEGGISFFMQKLLTAYSKYYNSKKKRSGSLFGGNFKATHLNMDEYLQYIYSYSVILAVLQKDLIKYDLLKLR